MKRGLTASGSAALRRPIFPIDLIDITVAPVLAWFERLNDRMLGRMEVFRRMFVFARITTADMAAGATQAQVHPGVAHLQTFFTPARVRRHVAYLVQMRTNRIHGGFLSVDMAARAGRSHYFLRVSERMGRFSH